MRRSLSDQIMEQLAELITNSDIQPGDLLPPTGELAESYDVSLPVIREALKSLEGQGLIRLVKGKGSIVLPIDRHFLDRYFTRAIQLDSSAVAELLIVRRGLESEAAALAAMHRTEAELANLGQIVEGMRATMEDPSKYAELDVAFHVGLAEATRNGMLYMLTASVRSAMKESVLVGLQRPSYDSKLKNEVQGLHEAVFAAVERQDPQAAAQCMRDHFDNAVAAVVAGR